MTKAWENRSLAEDLVARASEDWVSEAEVIDLVRRSGLTNGEDLLDLSIGLIVRLIVEGKIMLGSIESEGYVKWPLSTGDAITRLVQEWLGHPDPLGLLQGTITWITVTHSGQSIGHDLWRREGSL